MTSCAIDGCDGTAALRYRLSRFDVLVCERCGMLFRHPLPSAREIHAMYEDPAYHASAYFASGATAAGGPEADIHERALRALEVLLAGGGQRRLLDVGCGNGAFLARARAHGWEVEGVELSQALSRRCRAETGITPRCGDYLALEPSSSPYRAICMWDFLEHTLDPVAVLRRALYELEPEGRIVIFTIDSDSLFNVLGALAYRLPIASMRRISELLYDARHNYYFSARTLDGLLGRCGLEVETRTSYPAHLGRWLAEPAPMLVRIGGRVVDGLAAVIGRRYRQLLICGRKKA